MEKNKINGITNCWVDMNRDKTSFKNAQVAEIVNAFRCILVWEGQSVLMRAG